MKRYPAIFIVLLCLILLVGCQKNTDVPTEDTLPSTEVTEQTEPKWTGYTGSDQDYVYYYDEGRNLNWEEDILYLARSYLTDDMQLRSRQFIVNLPGGKTDAASFYDADLREQFLSAVNALIPEVGGLEDEEILYRIQSIIALFGDAHTRLDYRSDAVFPILFMPIYEDGQPVFYAVALPRKNENLLYSELTAINNVPIAEIIERMESFACHENDYGLIHKLAGGGYAGEYLSYAYSLEAVGIIGMDEQWATYTLTDSDGNSHDLTVKSDEEFTWINKAGYSLNYMLPIPYLYDDSENYWYTTALAESTLYVRISSFAYEEEETYSQFAGSLTVESNNTGHFQKVIVDLRGNGGGYNAEGWLAIINALGRMDFDEFYILVDQGTYSCSILFASEVEAQIPEAIFVGTPTGEAPGFFAGIFSEAYVMPNCGVSFTIPTQYYQAFPANEENALIPDVVIWPTIEDYQNFRDAVLEYVLSK